MGSWTMGHPDGFPTCPNLAMCFFETLDVGMRTGDIVGEAMDSVTYRDGLTYADRVLFGIVFFFLLGVILFDIVTGIIIDTFSSLREETVDRLILEDQPMWNYVLFMAYLRQKDSDSYSG